MITLQEMKTYLSSLFLHYPHEILSDKLSLNKHTVKHQDKYMFNSLEQIKKNIHVYATPLFSAKNIA